MTSTFGWGTLVAAIIVVVIFIWYSNKDEKQKASMYIEGLMLDKQLPCYTDADCPDYYSFCGAKGYCIPSEMQPRFEADPVLGRGRGGEGARVFRSNSERKGQRS